MGLESLYSLIFLNFSNFCRSCKPQTSQMLLLCSRNLAQIKNDLQDPDLALSVKQLEDTRHALYLPGFTGLPNVQTADPSFETVCRYNWSIAQASALSKQSVTPQTMREKDKLLRDLEVFLGSTGVGRDLMSCVLKTFSPIL